jgi:hypothetical protein
VLARRLALPVLLLAVLAPLVVALVALWSRTGEDLDAVRRERAGAVAVGPIVSLIAATADAQTRAVAGGTPDQAPLRAAIAAVDAADGTVGVTLSVDRRWASLRARIGSVLASPSRGADAYTVYSQLVDLELALLVAVGDTSGLAVDPNVDTHYLADATVVRIPRLVVDAGRISDLTLLVEQRKAPVEPDTLAVAVAAATMRQSAAQLDEGLRKGFEDTRSRTLGPGLLGELDRLRDAVTELAPPLSAVGSAPIEQAAATDTSRQQLRTSALETHSAALEELSTLIDARADEVTAVRRTVAGVSGGGLALALVVLWFAAPRRRPADVAESLTDGASAPADDAAPVGPHGRGATGDDDASIDLLEARELLEARQLLRVGRAVARREEAAAPAEEGP